MNTTSFYPFSENSNTGYQISFASVFQLSSNLAGTLFLMMYIIYFWIWSKTFNAKGHNPPLYRHFLIYKFWLKNLWKSYLVLLQAFAKSILKHTIYLHKQVRHAIMLTHDNVTCIQVLKSIFLANGSFHRNVTKVPFAKIF